MSDRKHGNDAMMEEGRIVVVRVIMLLVGVLLVAYGIYYTQIGKVVLGWLDIGMAGVVMILAGLKRRIEYKKRTLVFISLMMSFLGYLLIDGGTGNVAGNYELFTVQNGVFVPSNP